MFDFCLGVVDVGPRNVGKTLFLNGGQRSGCRSLTTLETPETLLSGLADVVDVVVDVDDV